MGSPMVNTTHQEIAIFAAGCFWGVEHAFGKIEGVVCAESGYIGGQTQAPVYADVCTGTTGHAEAVRVTFDSKKVDYSTLLDAFWNMHDPTQKNRQGADVGEQYRSAIFCTSESQMRTAIESRTAQQDRFNSDIVTEIELAGTFWLAESYHQKYLEKRHR